MVHFGFKEVNKILVPKPSPIPQISTVLQELEDFTYATQLCLNIGYYTIRLDLEASKIYTFILPWSRYSYERLPMGITGSPDIFQENMLDLTRQLESVCTYLDNLIVFSGSNFSDHLEKLTMVLTKLRSTGLQVNVAKGKFAATECEYI